MLDDPGFLVELAPEPRHERLAPLERSAWQAPHAVVRAANEHDAPVGRPSHRGDPDDGAPQEVTRDFMNDAVSSFGKPSEEHRRRIC